MKYNIIKTEKYLLAIDDSEIKVGDWFYLNDANIIAEYISVKPVNEAKKIIAHLPLNNSPVLEGVPLLPPLEDEVEGLAKKHLDSLHNNEDIAHPELYDAYHSFKAGYNTAKKRYKYTEEDLRKAMAMYKGEFTKGIVYTQEQVIQSLQQPKMPVAFECETEVYMYSINGDIIKPKTTTNPQGQTVLVGEYIY
jgi:hypothetical protein